MRYFDRRPGGSIWYRRVLRVFDDPAALTLTDNEGVSRHPGHVQFPELIAVSSVASQDAGGGERSYQMLMLRRDAHPGLRHTAFNVSRVPSSTMLHSERQH